MALGQQVIGFNNLKLQTFKTVIKILRTIRAIESYIIKRL